MWIVVIAMPGSQDDNYRHVVLTGPNFLNDIPLPKINPYTGEETNWRELSMKLNNKEKAEIIAKSWKQILEAKDQNISAWVEEI
jgi:hypothetical protein